MTLTQEALKKAVYYNPELGEFYARFGTKNRRPWRKLGTINAGGYSVIYVAGKLYYAHVLALLYVDGVTHKGHTDHINGRRADNRYANLRAVSASVNGQNRKQACVSNPVGLLGVSPKRKKFRARITVARKELTLGSFSAPELAHEAYLTAKRKLHEGNTL